MKRKDIIKTIGDEFHIGNIENDEYSYCSAGICENKGHFKLDLRFSNGDVSVLVETKPKFSKKDELQLFSYVNHEKKFGINKIIAMLVNTNDDNIKVWKNDELLKNEKKIKSFQEYIEMFNISKTNNKQKVMQATYNLNEMLHGYISENLRSQFVGTCLLALQNNLQYQNLPTNQIIAGITTILQNLLQNDINRATKIAILNTKVLGDQEVRELSDKYFQNILKFIEEKIIPFINEKTNQGQDLLNLFFTTFNKYVGKKDKNQAFTPDHIVHFMCKVAGINKNSKILDPTCGSGAFLVQALTQALKNCNTEEEIVNVKQKNIFGIEKEEKAFGLATTNMLIHGDGNSNIVNGSCFDRLKDIKNKGINIVLMNPPYNATIKDVPKTFSDTWRKKNKKNDNGEITKKENKFDPTKGFYFVYQTAEAVKEFNGKLLCLLPLSCAIGSDSTIANYKKKMLENHTLEAVFTLPADIFHPGASASACCMVFQLNTPHSEDKETFFGYYKNDGFIKKKNLGRVDIKNQWDTKIEKEWLDLYFNKKSVPGMSIKKIVSYNDEWLAEAYMETDYSTLSEKKFEETLQNFFAYMVSHGYNFYNKLKNITLNKKTKKLDKNHWQKFKISDYFDVKGTTTTKLDTLNEEYGSGSYPYVTTQAINNGVAGFYNHYTETGNVLVADSAVLGYVTYQQDNFSASDHTEKLIPKFAMNKYSALFLTTILNAENYRYSYGRKFNQDNIRNTFIKLPALPDGFDDDGKQKYKPDWQYMEDYIKSLPYSDLI